jgi:hypothetical protein
VEERSGNTRDIFHRISFAVKQATLFAITGPSADDNQTLINILGQAKMPGTVRAHAVPAFTAELLRRPRVAHTPIRRRRSPLQVEILGERSSKFGISWREGRQTATTPSCLKTTVNRGHLLRTHLYSHHCDALPWGTRPSRRTVGECPDSRIRPSFCPLPPPLTIGHLFAAATHRCMRTACRC